MCPQLVPQVSTYVHWIGIVVKQLPEYTMLNHPGPPSPRTPPPLPIVMKPSHNFETWVSIQRSQQSARIMLSAPCNKSLILQLSVFKGCMKCTPLTLMSLHLVDLTLKPCHEITKFYYYYFFLSEPDQPDESTNTRKRKRATQKTSREAPPKARYCSACKHPMKGHRKVKDCPKNKK